MEFERLLEIIGQEPVFETTLLLSGDVDSFDVRRQLTRWTASGKIYQLRKGLYSLAPPYQKNTPKPYYIANRLMPNSYVSLQSALAHDGLIPELVPITTSVTTGRPAKFDTPFGRFDFRHIRVSWFLGYHRVDLGEDQRAFIALPEKAILDLVYLHPGGDAAGYLRSLRLQALEKLDGSNLHELAARSGKPKLRRAARVLNTLIEEEAAGYQNL